MSKEVSDSELLYPKTPLQCSNDVESKNVLVILIDALRPEMLTHEIMPNMSKLFNESSNFENHYSGGTSSRMGMFSLFYGLPSTYWRVFHDNLKPSLLIQQFDESGYDVRAISSSGLGSPAVLDRTAFAGISKINLKPLSDSEVMSLQLTTDLWEESINQKKMNQNSSRFSITTLL